MASKYNASDYTFQLITVTAGVLIALLIDGLVDWKSTRDLVSEARASIAREIADNQKDLQITIDNIPRDLAAMDNAIGFANDLLDGRKTTVNEIKLHYNLADLSDTSWRTAERTGALANMNYAEVKTYSLLYDRQDLYAQQQRTVLPLLSSASAILSSDFDPERADPKAMQLFRERVTELRAAVVILGDFAKGLAETYAQALKQ